MESRWLVSDIKGGLIEFLCRSTMRVVGVAWRIDEEGRIMGFYRKGKRSKCDLCWLGAAGFD